MTGAADTHVAGDESDVAATAAHDDRLATGARERDIDELDTRVGGLAARRRRDDQVVPGGRAEPDPVEPQRATGDPHVGRVGAFGTAELAAGHGRELRFAQHQIVAVGAEEMAIAEGGDGEIDARGRRQLATLGDELAPADPDPTVEATFDEDRLAIVSKIENPGIRDE